MVDLTLEEFQRNQSIRISRDIIGQSEAHEQKMQTNAQRLWENAHKQLVALLRSLDQDYDESCEKANHSLESFSDDDLAYLIHVRLRAMQDGVSRNKMPVEIDELKQRLKEFSQKYTDQEQKLFAALELSKSLQVEKSALEARLSSNRQVQKEFVFSNKHQQKTEAVHSGTGMSAPDWIQTWQSSKLFEKTSMAILVMGEMGIALRPTIIKRMAKKLSLSDVDKNLDEALNWLMTSTDQSGPVFIEQVRGELAQVSSAGGNQPAVLRLTRKGQTAYQVLFGETPKENEFDMLIRYHSSPELTILIIQAGEILVEEGYKIRSRSQPFRLSNGETYIPDIIAVDPKTGEIIFVEVERDVSKDQISRKQKWVKFYEASNGNLYVFCDNLNCQRVIQCEINLALGGLIYSSFLTNLHELRNGKRAEKDGSIWFSQRQGK